MIIPPNPLGAVAAGKHAGNFERSGHEKAKKKKNVRGMRRRRGNETKGEGEKETRAVVVPG